MSASISIINFYRLILLFVIINHGTILAYSIHRRSMVLDDDQTNFVSSNIGLESQAQQNYVPAIRGHDNRRGMIRWIPYKKRTIPLELQKALYAHGIVGRRR